MDRQFDLAQKSCPPDCCTRCAVREEAICAGLDAPDRAALSRIGRRVTLRPGQTVMWEGEGSRLVANVIEGTFKLSTTTGDGREQILGIAAPADFIGRPFGTQMPHSVTALTDARLCLYPRGEFDGFARAHAPLEHGLFSGRSTISIARAPGSCCWAARMRRRRLRPSCSTCAAACPSTQPE